jgi:hypothetical protein
VAASYQWFLEGVALSGATGRELLITSDGLYSVRTGDAFGCVTSAEIGIQSAELIVELPMLVASPGEVIDIPITVRSAQQLESFGFTGYSSEIRFHGGLLNLLSAPMPQRIEGTQRIISIERAEPVTNNPIAVLRGRAMLGPAEKTALHFDSFAFTGARARVTLIDGELRIRVCEEGGSRLFDAMGILRLAQNTPNPFNATTRVDFELIEDGATRVAVYDLLGRIVATLVDAPMQPGVHGLTFDASALASGVYVLALHTPSRTLTRSMILAK